MVLVVPNNFAELQGRVFKSQVKKIQEELGNGIFSVVVKGNELASTLKKLKTTPDLVIADNQTILKVVDNIPESVKLTTYLLVMSRQQGNLSEFITGIKN